MNYNMILTDLTVGPWRIILLNVNEHLVSIPYILKAVGLRKYTHTDIVAY